MLLYDTNMVYRCLHGIGPEFSDFRLVSEIYSRQRLRSASNTDVVVPVTRRSSRIPGRRSSSVERATAQCHLRTISVLIPATPEDIFFSSDNCVNNTNYCVVVLKCLALSTMLILAN